MMKCRKCGQPAVINMRRHNLALCGDCYLTWFPEQVAKAIKRYRMFAPEDRILVAVSGGKDSLGLWDMLLRLGYQADGLYINLGIGHDDYSGVSRGYVERFVADRERTGIKLTLHVVDVGREYGATIPALVAQERNRQACSLCGLVKRHTMNRVAYEHGYNVLATGHNLDDEAATLFQNTLHWETGYMGRQGPVLLSTHPRLARKVKPLCLVYERESAAYVLLRGIEYVEQECPYSVEAMSIFQKGIINQLDARSPGIKLQFYQDFLRARERGAMTFVEPDRPDFIPCERCGQPTTREALCAFCRLWEG